jgi:hypothetical protein
MGIRPAVASVHCGVLTFGRAITAVALPCSIQGVVKELQQHIKDKRTHRASS